jgi:DNA polymerase-3 subunit alpha
MKYSGLPLRLIGFEHLHLHTDFSLLDGFGQVEEYAARWKNFGKYLCISDHGMLGAIPRQIKACEEHNLSPIFACELYVNRAHREPTPTAVERTAFMRRLEPADLKEFKQWGAHLLAIAYNYTGYQNLVQLSSWAFTNGFYARPRVNYEKLLQHKEGLIFTSCCYNSEIGRAFDRNLVRGQEAAEEAGFAMIERYMEMFPGHFYLELMLLDFGKQKPYDAFIIKASQKYGLPIIVTNDCHYCLKEDSHYQRIMLMVQTGRTLKEIQDALAAESMADFFELQDSNLWMKSEEELNEKWVNDYSDIIPLEIFEQAKLNTVEICKKARGVQLDRSIKLPVLADAELKLWEAAKVGFKKRGLKPGKYSIRLREEYELICRKGFASYFLIQKMMTDEARRVAPKFGFNPADVVGPGRGSGVGALMCYCLGITDVDPIEEDLLFSRFLSEARGGKQMQLRFKNIDPIIEESAA